MAAEANYPVAAIPAHLKEGANAVIREEYTQFKVISISDAVWKVKVVKTILNKKGKRDGVLILPYGKLSKIISIKGSIYDESGKLIEKVKNNEIKDLSAVSNFSLYEDSRIKLYEPKTLIYPYTIEYEYEFIDKNLLFYPTWDPQSNIYQSIVEASLEILVPKHLSLRYKQINLNEDPETSSDSNFNKYKWTVKNINIIKPEAYGPKVYELKPTVYTGPGDFEVEGYKGNMHSWESLGLWQNKLLSGRDKLSETTILKLNELVKDEQDDLGKVQKIYEYLQSSTRYVSIQLGIGGWQPFEASIVEKYGYGDCKALTNYTMSMLKAIGITSHYTLVKAQPDAKPIMTDFPSSQFNHVFLCVPLQKDTVWLECTSQQNPFGFLGDFTSDRHVLLITENGGKLVKTPAYEQDQNLQSRSITIKLQADGNAHAQISTKYTGLQFSNVQYQLDKTDDDQRTWLYKNINIASFEIKDLKYNIKKTSNPVIQEDLQLLVRNCASVTGKRIFISPNLMNKISYNNTTKPDERKTEIVTNFAYHDIDTVRYQIPEGYYSESFPESTSIQSIFGEYHTTFINEENTITYIREIKMNKGRYPAASFTEFMNFRKEISKADKVKIVLINKT